jgi:NADH:ubiquinone oxidoreductase subunit B-like Fe-S oxidoreductase
MTKFDEFGLPIPKQIPPMPKTKQSETKMNPRLLELYEQSLEEKFQYGGAGAKPGEMYSNYVYVLNPEKFAQLIVRECCDIFVELRTRPADLAVKDVKKHFGVE